MAWLAVDEDGSCAVFKSKPHRVKNPTIGDYWNSGGEYSIIDIDVVEIILDRKLTWEDEPVEIKEVKYE